MFCFRLLLSASLLTAMTLSGCTHAFSPPMASRTINPNLQLAKQTQPKRKRLTPRQQVVAAARTFLDGQVPTARGYKFESDPIGFVRAAFWTEGIELFATDLANEKAAHGMQLLYESAKQKKNLHQRRPRPGDLIFFSVSAKAQPYPTQVAVVEKIRDDGTIMAIGRFANGPQRIAINRQSKTKEKNAKGVQINDLIGYTEGTPAAQLFTTFANPFESSS